MRYALAALMACTLIACESHEDIVEEVDRNVSRQLEQKFKDEGFEDAYCLLVGPGLVQLNDAQYKGVVRCRDGVLGDNVDIKILVTKDGDEYMWETQ